MQTRDSREKAEANGPVTERDRPLRTDIFSARHLDPERQLAAWADFMSPVLHIGEVLPPEIGFEACARAYDLGKLHLARCELGPMEFKHTPSHIRASGVDHWCLTVLSKGEESVRSGRRTLHASAGSIYIHTLAAPFRGRSSSTSSVRLLLSRDNYADLAPILDALSFKRLEGTLMGVLRDYILALGDMMSDLHVRDIPQVVNSFDNLLSAVMVPSAERFVQSGDTISLDLYSQARNYIQQHLDMRNLGSDVLCSYFRISRRKLYYLFERSGGVARYIKRRRLEACRRAIINTTDHRLISTIAYSFGFEDAALFSKQFQMEFGCSPRDARLAKSAKPDVLSVPAATFAEWLMPSRDQADGAAVDVSPGSDP